MSNGEFTRLLNSARQGDEQAHQQLLPQVYAELRSLAQQYMRRENAGHTLQSTALVNEAYLRLLGTPEAQNRG
ncbi:MAG: ECF-type sigma factor, partial [Pseudomonadota bacterium]